MAHRLVKTPNGQYAAWYDIVDHFIAYDMDRNEALKFCVDEWDLGPKASERKVSSADEDITMNGSVGRYREAMNTVRIIHGDEEYFRYCSLLGSP